MRIQKSVLCVISTNELAVTDTENARLRLFCLLLPDEYIHIIS